MTTPRQLTANRRNARASTGPKSDAGKARSARNAFRHGLAIPVWSDAEHSIQAEDLACRIAGENSSPEILSVARRVAEAQIDLGRIRAARRHLLAPAFSYVEYSTVGNWKNKRPPTRKYLDILYGLPGPEKLQLIIEEVSDHLQSMERYERRALSRLKKAVQALDTQR
jgi:hypothetical protein